MSHSTIPTEIDWSTLSERGQAIARQIGTRILDGYTPREIARELGTSSKWVSTRLDELRDEISNIPRA